jgi:hypothetical protein
MTLPAWRFVPLAFTLLRTESRVSGDFLGSGASGSWMISFASALRQRSGIRGMLGWFSLDGDLQGIGEPWAAGCGIPMWRLRPLVGF